MAVWDFRNNIENTIFRDTLSYSNGQPQTKGNNWLIKVIVKRNVEQPIKLFSGICKQSFPLLQSNSANVGSDLQKRFIF